MPSYLRDISMNNTAASAFTVTADTIWLQPPTASSVYAYQPLQSITDPFSEQDFRSRRELTPVEWLRRQVEDVCIRAAMA